MTFSTQVKEEISKTDADLVSALTELSAFIRFDATIKKDEITLVIENASIARRIYKFIKMCFNIKPKIIVRIQKRFRVKQIYILSINEKIPLILETLFLYITIKCLSMNEMLAKIISNIIVLIANYILSKYMIFKKERGKVYEK